ncbi:hypothetical protein LOTGIDRAFT_235688 [Lottia gigantea]|uniref:WW domain-containing protein n=1 Tax=Lottia gigantea TaxID=225164 RepID=V3ZY67_LOTGI|nr:hypothetical protein LOTGIDRAFT_235688 [Lottia gigantea]ESO85911.1 hypothetical protein LOTGIDRAFT_235688 [Lottia gigantea]
MDKKGPLPPGYEAKWDSGQKAYFYINHNDKTTTWVDPRTTMAAQARPRTPQKAFTPRNQNAPDLSKIIQMFPDCPDEILQSVMRSCENNMQSAVHQLKMLGFKESRTGQSISPTHSAVKGKTSQTKQHKTPSRKSTQSNEFDTSRDHGSSASTSNSERTSNSYARVAPPSGHVENNSAHLVTDTSTNQRVSDTSTNQRVTDTSTNQRVTDTSTNQGITNISSDHLVTNQGITDRSTNQGITDTSSNQRVTGTSREERRTEQNNRRRHGLFICQNHITFKSTIILDICPSKTVYTSSIKDTSFSPTHQSIAVGRNRSLQSGPDPTLRLSEHVAANGHDPSLMQGPDSDRRAGSSGWVGADPSLCSGKRVLVTNI